ncbi:PAAR domain-containing protein [Rhizobium sp. CSW-27]|uniref:PAAR domain-containing protein n=1 Tax=Rhizobium sp. CSW-27 TaxID=2839985 RepID=UPI001C031C84|nr:PAAR domain-containing protein [Rhizobium sp. CSW-27]MBT9373066.1 PAAR domain-containing protein [Rhizobium sp. CSW-27]
MGKPAARLSDYHLCPMVDPGPKPHIGGPILPACSTNILIGNLPAARVTDKALCIGPPDTIIQGSPTVFFNNLMAARMGDGTAHGGVIIMGQMNVLIGERGGGAGFKMTWEALKSAAAAGYAFIKGEPFAESETVTDATEPASRQALQQRAAQLADARAMAMLAAAAYEGEDAPLPPNTRRATLKDLEALGLYKPATGAYETRLPNSDFRADVFVHTDPETAKESYTIAFKGTTTLEDWWHNLIQGNGFDSRYYNQAARIATRVSNRVPGNVRFTGHSLGGGLASAAAVASGEPAITFNAAGLHPSTQARVGKISAPVDAWFHELDPLSQFQDNNPGIAPSAYGTRHPVAAAPLWTSEETAMVSAHVDRENWIPDFVERAYGTVEAEIARYQRLRSLDEVPALFLPPGFSAASELGRQRRLHSMDKMQDSLAREAERVSAELAQEPVR